MRKATAIFGLLVLGVVMLSGDRAGSNSNQVVPTVTSHGSSRADSSVRQWDGNIIPVWWARGFEMALSSQQITTVKAASPDSSSCSLEVEFSVSRAIIAPRFDSIRSVSEFYVSDAFNGRIIRHDIDSLLNHTQVVIPLDSAVPWIATDLDLDGEIELISQWGDELRIHSAPDWILRAVFVWPGFNVQMYPVLTNIDADLHFEIYVTPNGIGGAALAVIIDYDSVADSFLVISEILAPSGTAGQPAVGDFDEDGRMEFISGNFSSYGLFEWQDSTLVYISDVGGSYNGYYATACRPKPDGHLRALLGHLSGDAYYQLLHATGDNVFEVEHVFTRFVGASGISPNLALDSDCDGLDELTMDFYPIQEEWEWDIGLQQFVQGCTWDTELYGSLIRWYSVDLDQDGRRDWGTVNHEDVFRAFADADCANCDNNGYCTPPNQDCYCYCFADPSCDGATNVLDVVGAVNVAFRGAPPDTDPFPQCPFVRTDVDCDSDTDVLDVVHLVNVAFRGQNPVDEFCDPCQ